MPDFALFRTVEGEPVAVNVEKVTYVRPRIDGNGILIAFPGDDGVGVEGSLMEVVNALRSPTSNGQFDQ
jgi:hypothetical protein